ncbi:MAG: rhodanese-like domain-containing protein [Aerococcus sp.]|nr:rhodanese-like domain-containing protein [Aerococcus sp.]
MVDSHQHLRNENYTTSQAPATSRLVMGERQIHPQFFADAQWLHQRLLSHHPPLVIDVTRGKGNYPLDTNRTAEDFAKAHIPGAIHLNTDELGEFKDYFVDVETMKQIFLSKGVTADTQVVFYSIYARNILYIASRMAFAAYYLGVQDVKILDGGFQAWQRAGYPIETGTTSPDIVTTFNAHVPRYPDLLIRTPEDVLTAKAKDPTLKLVSVRSWNEFIGKNEGHQWNKDAGEIAGAIYAGDEKLANELGEIAAPNVYQGDWEDWGIQPTDHLLLYCGTSWRSATLFFLMKELGYQHLQLFDGSWHKWYLAHEKDPQRFPIQRGDPRDKESYEVIDE